MSDKYLFISNLQIVTDLILGNEFEYGIEKRD